MDDGFLSTGWAARVQQMAEEREEKAQAAYKAATTPRKCMTCWGRGGTGTRAIPMAGEQPWRRCPDCDGSGEEIPGGRFMDVGPGELFEVGGTVYVKTVPHVTPRGNWCNAIAVYPVAQAVNYMHRDSQRVNPLATL